MNDINRMLPHIQLRFNIDHPTLEDCYHDGYECAIAEIEEQNNPFPIGTQEYELWSEGWWDGLYAEQPVFEKNIEDHNVIDPLASNDAHYTEHKENFFIKLLEISGMIAVSAIVSYQIIELVA